MVHSIIKDGLTYTLQENKYKLKNITFVLAIDQWHVHVDVPVGTWPGGNHVACSSGMLCYYFINTIIRSLYLSGEITIAILQQNLLNCL